MDCVSLRNDAVLDGTRDKEGHNEVSNNKRLTACYLCTLDCMGISSMREVIGM